jgi:phosphatidylinositol-3-phosphatase
MALVAAGGCAQAHQGAPLAIGPVAGLPRPAASHVVVLVMENAESGSVLGSPSAPYVNSLVSRYGLATRSYAITHPSLPNYLALTSGSTQGAESDCTDCHFVAANLLDQLQRAGISWKAYLEGVPGVCFRGAGADGYAKKHNPFIYYDDVARSPARCRRLVGFETLAADLRSGRLATFSWITPNLCDDGHDCSLRTADRFLARTIPPLLRELGPHGFLVLTWDEGTTDRGCCGGAAGGRVLTLVAGPDVRRGGRYDAPVDHYGVLGTIEQALGLPALGRATDPRSGRLTALFTQPPHLQAIG